MGEAHANMERFRTWMGAYGPAATGYLRMLGATAKDTTTAMPQAAMGLYRMGLRAAQLSAHNWNQNYADSCCSAPKSNGLTAHGREVIREMKKVSWPTVQETNRLTGVVLLACFTTVFILTLLGYFFETLIRIITKGH